MSKKSPQLRFKGFTDDWEDRNLKDILREFSTKSKIENEYRVLSSTNVGMEFRDGRVSGTSNLGYKIIKNGDLVLSPQNLWLGNININNIGTGLVSPSYKTFNFTDIDSSFIKPQLRTPKMLEEYKNSSTQGASVVRRNLEIDSFYQIKIATPSIKEQEKIGSFFKHLDSTISLHQRKLDLLKEQKKGYLQKMFPKNGEKVPELRFAGFADDWEERKLSDIVVYIKGFAFKSNWEERKLSDIVVRLTKSSNNNQLPKVEFEDIIAGEGRLNKDISRKFDDRKGTLFEPDNILYGKLRPYLKNWLFSDFKGIALGDFWVFKSKNSEPKFVYSLIQADNYQRVANDTSGTKMPRSDWKKVSSSNFSIPTSLEEQQKIGSFFKQLDNTIALHQRKLDLLKEQKKGYLQKMFAK